MTHFDSNTESGPLTEDALRRAFEAVRDAEYRPCPHVVHPKSEGWTTCANLCGAVVYIEQVAGFPVIVDPPPTAAGPA